MIIILAQALLIAALGFFLQSWFWVALVPLAFGLAAHVSPALAAGRGAAAGGSSWLGTAAYFYLTSGGIIAGRMAAMFGLGRKRGWLLVLLTGLLGTLVAGLAAYAGASLREALRKKTNDG
jgi:MFS family permease